MNAIKSVLILITLMTLSIFSAFAQQDQKASAIRKEIAENKAELVEAKKDSVSDYKLFKEESEAKIRQNELMIAQLKKQKIEGKKVIAEKYNKDVAKLEAKNNKLRTKIKKGNNCVSAKRWRSFKHQFDLDMQALDRSIDDLGKAPY